LVKWLENVIGIAQAKEHLRMNYILFWKIDLKNIVQCCISFNYFELKNHEDDEVIFRGICICQAKVDEK
jgi:hypothetical protein